MYVQYVENKIKINAASSLYISYTTNTADCKLLLNGKVEMPTRQDGTGGK